MGLTISKTIDDYTYWTDGGPKLSKRKLRSKSHSSSSYKSAKEHPPLPFKQGENVYGLKKKSNKSKSKKTKKKSKGSKDKLK